MIRIDSAILELIEARHREIFVRFLHTGDAPGDFLRLFDDQLHPEYQRAFELAMDCLEIPIVEELEQMTVAKILQEK